MDLYDLAENEYVKGNYKKAYELFEKSYDNVEDVNSSLNYMGCCLIKLGKYKESIDIFDKLIEETLWERPMFNKGRALLELENYSEAFACFNRALMINPENSDVYYYLGVYYEKLKDYEGAKEQYIKSIHLDEKSVESHQNLGKVYFQLGEYEKSLTESELAFEYDNECFDALANKGFALYRLKRYSEALEVFNKVYEHDKEEDLNIMNDIANCFYHLIDIDSCLYWIEKVLKIDPHNEEALHHKEIALKKVKGK